MIEHKKYWEPLKAQLQIAKRLNLFLLVTTTALLPVVETVLANKWTGSPPNEVAGWSLVGFGVIHSVLVLYLIIQQVTAPALALAENVELAEKMAGCRGEIARRLETYRLVRSLFDILNARRCSLEMSPPNPEHTKLEYVAGLEPIIQKLHDNIDVILGVKSNQFSIQVWFLDGFQELNAFQSNATSLRCDYQQGNFRKESPFAIALNEVQYLPALCFGAREGFQKTIASASELLSPSGTSGDCSYYRQFVFSHILRPCTEERAGIVLVTSMQDERFAEDAVDTLAFFASVIANYTNGFLECIAQRQKPREWIITISGNDEVSGTWSLYQLNGDNEYFGPGIQCAVDQDGAWVEVRGKRLELKKQKRDNGFMIFADDNGISATLDNLSQYP